MTNIEQFTQELMLAHDIDYETAQYRANEFYSNVETETPSVLNGWISVDDRLPDNEDMVITYDGDGCMLDYGPLWGGITHWHPLPEPPQK